MYKLLCQLFLAITGQNLPEEAFDVIFPFLQGKRKGRGDIGLGVTDYSNITPHQILLCDIPLQYYQTWEQFLELKKKMSKKEFKNKYYLDSAGKRCKPSWESKNIWVDRTYEKPMVCLNYILYMKSEHDKRVVLNNLNRNEYDDRLRGIDISWASSCIFCGDFMRLSSYKLKNQKKDIEETCTKINKYGVDYNDEIAYKIRMGVPVCGLCRNSKERQELYRMNLLSRGDWGETFYHERSEQFHRDVGDLNPKPDMSKVPKGIKPHWDTPLDYSEMSYWNLSDPFSDDFWHPDLTADEYMRWMEHSRFSGINLDDPDPLDDDLYDQFEENEENVVEDVVEWMIERLEEQ